MQSSVTGAVALGAVFLALAAVLFPLALVLQVIAVGLAPVATVLQALALMLEVLAFAIVAQRFLMLTPLFHVLAPVLEVFTLVNLPLALVFQALSVAFLPLAAVFERRLVMWMLGGCGPQLLLPILSRLYCSGRRLGGGCRLGRRSPGYQEPDSQRGHRHHQRGLPDSIAHTAAISFAHGAVGPCAQEICNPRTNVPVTPLLRPR
jgi:hypothetical protein